MPDLTKEEWLEWYDYPATREIIRRIEDFRMQYLIGVLAVSRDERLGQIDSIIGMDLVIDMIKNIYKEVRA